MLSEYLKEQVRAFGPNTLNNSGGTQSRVFDVSDIPPGGSLYTKNIRFGGTTATCRYGIDGQLFSAANATGASPTGLSPHSSIADLYVLTPTVGGERYFYTDPTDNRRIDVYYKDLGRARHLVAGTPALQGFALEEVGVSAILAGYDAALGAAFTPIRVATTTSPADLGNLEIEPVFPANPAIDTAVPDGQDTGGLVTTGSHEVGYVFETKFGTMTKPVKAGTVTIGGSNTGAIGMVVTPDVAWPSYFVAAYVVMTNTTNSSRFFLVPESRQTVPSGTTPITWDKAGPTAITPADTTLESYTEVTSWFNYLRADDTTGLLPVTPFFVTRFGDRVVYLVQRVPGSSSAQVLVSDINNPSGVTLDQHSLFLSTSESLTGAFSISGLLIVCTDAGTRSYVDTGDVPALWPNPTIVSKSLGMAGPQSAVSNDNGSDAFVMTRDGNVFQFNGAGYSHNALSALIYENRLDLHMDPAAKLTYDPRENILYCCYADRLDVAANATPGAARKDRKKTLIFDVTPGIDPEYLRLSEWAVGSGDTRVWINKAVINPNVFQYSGVRGVIFAMCHETFGTEPKCAIGMTTIYKDNVPNIARDRVRYIDNELPTYFLPMDGEYHTGYFPSEKQSSGDILNHAGMYFSLRGACDVDIAVKPLNDANSYPINPVDAHYDDVVGPDSGVWGVGIWGQFIWGGPSLLDRAPTKTYRRLYRRHADKLAYVFKFTTDPTNQNSFFQLTEITHYYGPWAGRR